MSLDDGWDVEEEKEELEPEPKKPEPKKKSEPEYEEEPEEEVEDIAALVAVLVLNALFVGNFASLFEGSYLVEVNARIFLYCVKHCDSFKRLAEIHLNAVIGDDGCA